MLAAAPEQMVCETGMTVLAAGDPEQGWAKTFDWSNKKKTAPKKKEIFFMGVFLVLH